MISALFLYSNDKDLATLQITPLHTAIVSLVQDD